jgi:D-sedoheptulose 7-phosphate isomerase
MGDISDYFIKIPNEISPRIQEGHLLVEHILCELIENALFKKE